ncbi:hypothetical protein [uncultured Nostoc sp.]|uniref:hypothetical protein n=1 Tax=uncultured Nostoc sp. TaxID=340711 RepID=UPI0035CA0802
MAGLYDIVKLTNAVTASGGEAAETDIYYFRVTAGFYSDGAIATATGLTVVTGANLSAKALTPVKELIRAGVLKTATLTALGTGNKRYRVKLHFAKSVESTVEAAMSALNVPNVEGKKSSGAAFKSFSQGTRVTSRS